jgi:hypothetical protein
MTQELGPLGVDCMQSWELHRNLWSIYRRDDVSPRVGNFDLVNADWEGLKSNPIIAVTLHYDPLFFHGTVRLAAQIERDLDKPVCAVVRDGLESSSDGYRDHIKLLSIESPGFARDVMSALQERGMLVATLDANLGSSQFHNAPFLQHELKVRVALFRLARASGARILPFIVNSQADRTYLGPVIDVRACGVPRAIDQAVRFLEHHVIRAPERWMHWRYAFRLTSTSNTNASLAGMIPGSYRWVVSADNGLLAFDLKRMKLFALDEETYRALLDGKDAGHDSE